MSVAIGATDRRILTIRTRMPFAYGIAAATVLPHVLLGVDLEVDGRIQRGLAAENLVPKWFTKNPQTPFADDVAVMLAVIEAACLHAVEAGSAPTVFDLWQRIYQAQMRWAREHGHPPLLANLGVSLVERAAIDAFTRATATPFATAIRANTLGIRLGALYDELDGLSPADLLPARPLRSIVVRQTVGLSDPLTDDEIPAERRLDDGLPQSLAAALRTYGLTHLKIKLCGDPAGDAARLERIAAVIETTTTGPYAVTLDANETYRAVAPVQELWRALTAAPALAPFLRRVLFVEQPLQRDIALSPAACRALLDWEDRPPIIIDESDGVLGDVRTALEGGYVGTSHKNCKGVIKGIANACLIAHRQRRDPSRRYILSGEDLTTVGPVALLQDLAVMATLGIAHVERNGHHYVAGLSMLPAEVQMQILQQHGDLYRHHEQGFATLDIHGGAIDVGSVVAAPFGYGLNLDLMRVPAVSDWDAGTLQER